MDPSPILATQIGSINELYALIQQNPYILEIIDAIPFFNTPLHMASASGNLAFAMEMMNLKPSFARKLNTDGLSPLHLAIEEGQTRLVVSFNKVDPDLVRLRGREGTTPFHLVVRRGETDLMTEFLLACPGCIRDANVNGETALHMAVLNDRDEELQVLLGWVQRLRQIDAESVEIQFLNRRDQDGNTALHVAAYQKRFKAVKQLVKCCAVNRNIHNRGGLTVLDKFKNQREYHVENIVRKSGGKSGNSLTKSKKVSVILSSPISFTEHWFTQTARYRNQTTEGSRSALLVIAALKITATYQTALQPPGGVYQENASEDGGSSSRKTAGKVVMNQAYFSFLRIANSSAFLGAIFMAFCSLPAGEGYLWWFLWIALPLYASYLISMSVTSTDTLWYLSISAGSVTFLLAAYMLVFFLRWKLSRKKMPGTRSELILEGLTTLDLAQGVECR